MVPDLSSETIKDQYELYNRLKNNSRKKLLTYLYEQPRNYKDLAEFSGLKPGSLYHHLGVLEPLIEKIDHGQYNITELGTKVIESLDMVTTDKQKPKVHTKEDSNENKDNLSKPEVTTLQSDKSTEQTDEEETIISTDKSDQKEILPVNNLLEYIWISPTSYILLLLSIVVIFFLGLEGVAFAGSAIYAVGNSNAFLVDFLAIILGIGALMIIEDIQHKYPIYDRLKFITIIRVISMLPSLIIGITLLLLFITGVTPPSVVYPVIFTIGILMGTIAMVTGVHFLRAQPLGDAILYAIVPTSIDLLIGIVILISV